MVRFLSFDEYAQKTKNLGGRHWAPRRLQRRWDYHRKAIDILRGLSLETPKDVLEMGTMGITLVSGSDTIDYMEAWNYQGKSPTYVHDARVLPWPIQDKQYAVFVALRVFQHLAPKQAECVREAMRIAKRVIIVVPRTYTHRTMANSRGISYAEFVQINHGLHPNRYLSTALGDLYYWDTDQPSMVDRRGISVRLRQALSSLDTPFIGRVKSAISKVPFARRVKRMTWGMVRRVSRNSDDE